MVSHMHSSRIPAEAVVGAAAERAGGEGVAEAEAGWAEAGRAGVAAGMATRGSRESYNYRCNREKSSSEGTGWPRFDHSFGAGRHRRFRSLLLFLCFRKGGRRTVSVEAEGEAEAPTAER